MYTSHCSSLCCVKATELNVTKEKQRINFVIGYFELSY
jgi:hypothetical protein